MNTCYYCNKEATEFESDYEGSLICKDCYDSAIKCRHCGDLIFDEYHKNEEYCSDCL